MHLRIAVDFYDITGLDDHWSMFYGALALYNHSDTSQTVLNRSKAAICLLTISHPTPKPLPILSHPKASTPPPPHQQV